MADGGDNKTTTPDKPAVRPGDEPLGEGGLRALQAEREENRTLRQQMKEIQAKLDAADAEKLSKEELLTKQLNEANNRVRQYEQEKELSRIREKIADDTGVPAKLLAGVGSDEDSIKAFAATLSEHLKEQPRRPDPNPHAGSNNSGDGGDEDANARAVLGF